MDRLARRHRSRAGRARAHRHRAIADICPSRALADRGRRPGFQTARQTHSFAFGLVLASPLFHFDMQATGRHFIGAVATQRPGPDRKPCAIPMPPCATPRGLAIRPLRPPHPICQSARERRRPDQSWPTPWRRRWKQCNPASRELSQLPARIFRLPRHDPAKSKSTEPPTASNRSSPPRQRRRWTSWRCYWGRSAPPRRPPFRPRK